MLVPPLWVVGAAWKVQQVLLCTGIGLWLWHLPSIVDKRYSTCNYSLRSALTPLGRGAVLEGDDIRTFWTLWVLVGVLVW